MVIHHNRGFEGPRIDTIENFSIGKECHYNIHECSNSPLDVINIGLDMVIDKIPYHAWKYNCQIVSSIACNSKPKSEGVSLVAGVAILAIGIGIKKLSDMS